MSRSKQKGRGAYLILLSVDYMGFFFFFPPVAVTRPQSEELDIKNMEELMPNFLLGGKQQIFIYLEISLKKIFLTENYTKQKWEREGPQQ